jgi:hypothetical protein
MSSEFPRSLSQRIEENGRILGNRGQHAFALMVQIISMKARYDLLRKTQAMICV